MKHISLILLLSVLLSCNNKHTQVLSGLEGEPLPRFNMLLEDSVTYLNSETIPAGKPFVLFYFSTQCPYCRAMTEALKEDINTVNNLPFYFISRSSLDQIKKYDQQYGLSKYKNITVAQIRDSSFAKYYQAQGVPYIVVYDKQKQLKEVLLGKTDVEVIKDIAFRE